MASFLRNQRDGVFIAIKLQPRASRSGVDGVAGAELKIRVTAPPVDAAANEALLRLLADTIGCARSSVQLIRGQTSRHKTVLVCGTSADVVEARLLAAMER